MAKTWLFNIKKCLCSVLHYVCAGLLQVRGRDIVVYSNFQMRKIFFLFHRAIWISTAQLGFFKTSLSSTDKLESFRSFKVWQMLSLVCDFKLTSFGSMYYSYQWFKEFGPWKTIIVELQSVVSNKLVHQSKIQCNQRFLRYHLAKINLRMALKILGNPMMMR